MPCRTDGRLSSGFGPVRILRAAAFILIALGFCSAFHIPETAARTTIVPESERIPESEARLALARLLSYREATLEKAVLHYGKLITEQGATPIVHLEYGQLLLRIKAFAKAIAVFEEILNHTPDHPGAVEGLGDSYLYTGQTQKALAFYQAASGLKPDDQRIQGKLGLALSYNNRNREALALLEPVYKNAPENKEIGIALLRLYHQTAQVGKGLDFFRNNTEHFSDDPDALVEAAYLEVTAGHAARCRDLFLKAISIKGGSSDLGLRFAEVMNLWGDFFKIEGIYQEHLSRHPDDLGIQLKLAGLLRSSQRYEEAEGLYGILMYQGFPKARLFVELAGLKLQEKDFFGARSFLDRFFELPDLASVNDASASETDQTKNGDLTKWYQDACVLNAELFFSLKHYQKAYDAYQDLLSHIPDHSVPDKIAALIGMGKSALKLGDHSRAGAAFKNALALDPNHIEAKFYTHLSRTDPDTAPKAAVDSWIDPASASSMALTQWGRLMAARGWSAQAVFCYETALDKDPDNFPARLELAELLGLEKDYEKSINVFKTLDGQFPHNYKIKLGLARVLAWSRAYDPAFEIYESLLTDRPRHPVLLMELARTKAWAKEMDGAFETYEKLYTPSVDQRLLEQVDAFSIDVKDPFLNDRLDELKAMVEEASVYEGYEKFFQTAAGGMVRPLDPRLEKLRIQLLPAYRIQKTARLERNAKFEAYHLHFLTARDTLSELTAHQPGNQEAIFDRAQADCALGLCDEEAKAYQTLLDLDPLHSLARSALERNQIRNTPYVRTNYAYTREQGRGELSRIEHQRFDAQLDIPFSCRYHFRITGHRWLESPLGNDTATYEVNGHTLELSGVLTPALTGILRWTKKYDADEGFGGTDTGNAHFWLNLKDRVKIGMGADRRDVLDNEFSIRQETQVDSWWIGLASNPSRRLDLRARADYLSYSDDNDGKTGEVSAGYAFTDHPKVFKTILSAEYRDTRYENIFHYQGQTLTDITHPYWTPSGYWAGGLSLEWYHDLSEQLFCGSQHHFYDILFSIGQNSDRNPSIALSLKWHLEFSQNWMINIEGLIHRSGDWDADVFQAAIRYQF